MRGAPSAHRPHTASVGGPRALVAALLGLCILILLGALVYSGRSTVLFEGDGAFGAVQVVERSDGLRALYFDGGPNRQSALYPGRPLHLELPYSRVAMVGLALIPPDPRILFVGLGGGAMPTYVREVLPGARIDAVEIDPLVVEVAQEYFGFTPGPELRVHVGDGRAFLEGAPPGSWDLIVLDAFSESGIPRALTTRPFLEVVRSRLAPGGVVVSNVPTAHSLSPSMFTTWEAVFPGFQRIEVRRRRQQIVVASAGRALDRETLVEAVRELAGTRELGFDLPALVERGVLPAVPTGGEVLEDEAGSAQLRFIPPDPGRREGEAGEGEVGAPGLHPPPAGQLPLGRPS